MPRVLACTGSFSYMERMNDDSLDLTELCEQHELQYVYSYMWYNVVDLVVCKVV